MKQLALLSTLLLAQGIFGQFALNVLPSNFQLPALNNQIINASALGTVANSFNVRSAPSVPNVPFRLFFRTDGSGVGLVATNIPSVLNTPFTWSVNDKTLYMCTSDKRCCQQWRLQASDVDVKATKEASTANCQAMMPAALGEFALVTTKGTAVSSLFTNGQYPRRYQVESGSYPIVMTLLSGSTARLESTSTNQFLDITWSIQNEDEIEFARPNSCSESYKLIPSGSSFKMARIYNRVCSIFPTERVVLNALASTNTNTNANVSVFSAQYYYGTGPAALTLANNGDLYFGNFRSTTLPTSNYVWSYNSQTYQLTIRPKASSCSRTWQYIYRYPNGQMLFQQLQQSCTIAQPMPNAYYMILSSI